MDRDVLIDLLRKNIAEVTFTKVNGEERVMPCTLQEHLIPKKESNDSNVKNSKDTNLTVWCTDKNEWRSFRISSVTRVTVLY
jgi:WYL_2, Sm-like SH3 beta-barrel fold